jgi:hypothetical protein
VHYEEEETWRRRRGRGRETARYVIGMTFRGKSY